MDFKKYFFEDKQNNLYYESYDKEEVVDWLLDMAGIRLDSIEGLTPSEIELRNIILCKIEELVEEYEEQDEESLDPYEEKFRYEFDEGWTRYSERNFEI